MTRAAVTIVAALLLLGGAFYLGARWDAEQDADKKTITLERAANADTSKGDPTDDLNWVNDFLSGLPDPAR